MTLIRPPTLILGLTFLLGACGGGGPETTTTAEELCFYFDRVMEEFSEAAGGVIDPGGQPDFEAFDAAINDFESAARAYDRTNDTTAASNAAKQLPLDLAAGGGDGLNYFLVICEPYFEEQLGGY
jgi:hypothetical protein